jgi:hypothetical protein
MTLPRGTRIDVAASFDEDMLLPPAALPTAHTQDPSAVRLTLNVLPGT